MSKEVLEKIIREFESGKKPAERFFGKSMRELFESGEYQGVNLDNLREDEEKEIDILKVITLREGALQAVIIPFSDPDMDLKTASDMMVAGSKLPFDTSMFERYERKALDALEDKGLSTVAAMSLEHSTQGAVRQIQIYYPRLFFNLSPFPEGYQNRFALGLAGFFIQKTIDGQIELDTDK